jgi:hypothetical protein
LNLIKKTWCDIQPTTKLVREFGFILTGFVLLFPLFANTLGILFAGRAFHYWLGWPFVSVAVLAITFLIPGMMRLVYRFAMMVSHGISFVVMRVVLFFLFYFIFTPIGIIMKVFGKEMLDGNIHSDTASYWNKRSEVRPRADYERLF